jgi:hypothetical protein
MRPDEDLDDAPALDSVLKDVDTIPGSDEPRGPTYGVKVRKGEVLFTINLRVVSAVPVEHLPKFNPGSEDIFKILDIFEKRGSDAAVAAFK